MFRHWACFRTGRSGWQHADCEGYTAEPSSADIWNAYFRLAEEYPQQDQLLHQTKPPFYSSQNTANLPLRLLHEVCVSFLPHLVLPTAVRGGFHRVPLGCHHGRTWTDLVPNLLPAHAVHILSYQQPVTYTLIMTLVSLRMTQVYFFL